MNDRPTLSARGLVMGASIGLASGLFVDYLALLVLGLLQMPAPGTSLGELLGSPWFVPVILGGVVLGIFYYGSE